MVVNLFHHVDICRMCVFIEFLNHFKIDFWIGLKWFWPFFSEKLCKFAIFPLALNKASSYFCRPRTCFLGKNCLISESKINFTPWNRVLLSEWSILHLENAMFSKIRPYFLRTFCMGDRFMQKILKISAFSDTIFFRKFMSISDFRTRLEQSV